MNNIKEKIQNLRKQIDELRYKYHVLNDPEVTDAMYQGLMDELIKLEEEYPEYKTADSPTQRVAGAVLDSFEKVPHSVQQWSFGDAFNEEDLKNWEERNIRILEKELGHVPEDLDYTVELKIDGLHAVLTYKKGLLEVAATRGDGKVGENITEHIKMMPTVPIRLSEDVDIIVEGEIWMNEEIMKELNKKRAKEEKPLFANPRNAAAGTVRQLDSNMVKERKLACTVYDISKYDESQDSNVDITSQAVELKSLENLGFLTDHHWKVCKNVSEIIAFYDTWTGKQRSLDFWIDGLVVKVNKKKYQDILGYTGKSPRWGIAMKFPAEQGTTRIKDIYVQVGRTGALTPVAHMDPVALAGTTVTHATLHNFEEISRLDVRVGDVVVVEKAGDIIPKVVRVLTKMRTGEEKKIEAPEICPICHAEVSQREIQGKKEKSVAYFCTNKKCFSKELKNIIHFVSKKAFNIDGFGKRIVEQFLELGLIKNIADIFTLSEGDISVLEGFGEKSAIKLISAIKKARQVAFDKFLFSLGIHHVGEESAVLLANTFENIEALQIASQEEIEEINELGPKMAESLFQYFRDEENVELLKELFENGVEIVYEKKKEKGELPFEGKTFVITGTLEGMSRDEVKEKIRTYGGSISSSVSKKTDYLLAGESAGSKLEKAKKLGVAVVGLEIFGV
ncbi:MAG: NAD-dependent DNA ligase LigA [Candidatus Magasanikbacteria bacterium]|nr:NAD-dependent DNA ligase LigA [Candidatus Magasanikbacteria bacterium]